jgi:hypothetical protein
MKAEESQMRTLPMKITAPVLAVIITVAILAAALSPFPTDRWRHLAKTIKIVVLVCRLAHS